MTNDLREAVAKWNKNKEALGFSIKVSASDSGQKVKFDIKSEKKFRSAIQKLASEIIAMAIPAITQKYSYDIAPEDREAEKVKISNLLQSRYIEYFDMLLNQGLDELEKRVSEDGKMAMLQYETSHLSRKGNEWCRWNGNVVRPDDISQLLQTNIA